MSGTSDVYLRVIAQMQRAQAKVSLAEHLKVSLSTQTGREKVEALLKQL